MLQTAVDRVFQVSSVRRATPSTRIVTLDLGGQRFVFEAGQAAMIGEAERSVRVPYSIASAPEEAVEGGVLQFLVKVEPSGRWGHQFDRLARAMRLGVRGPFGTFVFPRKVPARPLLFIAGGTGIAPIRSMLRHARLNGRLDRVKLLYSARTTFDFAFLPELRGMARRGELDLSLHITREAPERWRGARGRISMACLEPLVDDPTTLCYICGPAAMVADVPQMLSTLGVDRKRIRVEDW